MENKPLYDAYAHGEHWKNHPEVYAETFIEFLKAKGISPKILDIGCGNGRDVSVFNKAGFETYGIDLSKTEVDLVKKEKPHMKVFVGNAENLPFKEESFDAAYMINVIHYVNKHKALTEAFRVLKKKGLFFIHFNLEIKRQDGRIDYRQEENEIMKLIFPFMIVKRKIIRRFDKEPIPHTHKILELILQKNQ